MMGSAFYQRRLLKGLMMAIKNALHSLEEMVLMQERMDADKGANRALMQLARPSAIRRPKVFKDGDKWCALEGENIQEGVCGFGDTPDAACQQFDIQWLNERPTPANR